MIKTRNLYCYFAFVLTTTCHRTDLTNFMMKKILKNQ